MKFPPKILKIKAQVPALSLGLDQQATLGSISLNFSAHIYAFILLPAKE